MRLILALAGLSALLPAAARAEVKGASPNSFVIEHRITLPLTQQQAWQTMEGIADWWDPAHTYGGEQCGQAGAAGGPGTGRAAGPAVGPGR